MRQALNFFPGKAVDIENAGYIRGKENIRALRILEKSWSRDRRLCA